MSACGCTRGYFTNGFVLPMGGLGFFFFLSTCDVKNILLVVVGDFKINQCSVLAPKELQF